MKKTFKLQDLECANCAAKMEDAIRRMEGVEEVQINFMRQAMTWQAADAQFAQLRENAKKAMKKLEPDVRVV